MQNDARALRETDVPEGVRVSLADDAGGIELIHASFRKHRFDAHFHDEFSIGVSLRGGLAFDHKGTKHVAPSGVISALNPMDLHNSYPAMDGGWAFICFLVPVEVLRTVVGEALGRDGIPAFRSRVIEDAALARRLVHLHRILETSREPLERQSQVLSTFAYMVQRHTTATAALRPVRPEREGVRRARELLHDCYQRGVSLSELADAAGLSRFHFLRVFREEVGLTPHAYLNHVRVLEAKRRLLGGSSIAEAALSCGFADQSHLARRFKQFIGFTPGQFQVGGREHGLA